MRSALRLTKKRSPITSAESSVRREPKILLSAITGQSFLQPSRIGSSQKCMTFSPILERSTKYNVKGTLEIPYYPESDATDIEMAYATEFTDLTSSAGQFTNITLTGFLAGALTLVSRSLINNSQFDIVGFVVDHMAYNISRWIEGELLKGTSSKIDGLSGVTQSVTAAASNAITADELIKLQDSVKDVFQDNSIWIMSSATRTALRLLKDDVGRYLLQDDITAPFGKVLLGKPVYVSDNMPDMATSATAIYYGDMSGLAVKITEEMEIQVLREKIDIRIWLHGLRWTLRLRTPRRFRSLSWRQARR